MAAAGASDRDRQVTATLGLVQRHQCPEQSVELIHERRADGGFEHEVAHLRVVSGERPQIVLPMRVGEEPHVHHDVGVQRQTVLEPETLDGDLQTGPGRCVEGVVDALLELVHVEVARVDHEVSGSSDRLEHRTLELDRFDEAVGLVGERMTSSGRVVTAHQFRRRRVEEDHPNVVSVGPQLTDLGEHLGVLAPGDQCEPLDVARRFRCQLHDRADQRGRQIVHDEPPEILQHIGDPRPTGPRQPGDQHDVGHPATLPIPPRPPCDER